MPKAGYNSVADVKNQKCGEVRFINIKDQTRQVVSIIPGYGPGHTHYEGFCMKTESDWNINSNFSLCLRLKLSYVSNIAVFDFEVRILINLLIFCESYITAILSTKDRIPFKIPFIFRATGCSLSQGMGS